MRDAVQLEKAFNEFFLTVKSMLHTHASKNTADLFPAMAARDIALLNRCELASHIAIQ